MISRKLEKIYKNGEKTHVRIVQNANVIKQRLRVIYDNTGKNGMLVGKVNKQGSIHWNNYVKLTTPQQKYIIDEVKSLRERIM